MHSSNYEALPHGSSNFRIAVFSEKKYDAPLHHHAEYAIFYLASGRMKFGIAGDDYNKQTWLRERVRRCGTRFKIH